MILRDFLLEGRLHLPWGEVDHEKRNVGSGGSCDRTGAHERLGRDRARRVCGGRSRYLRRMVQPVLGVVLGSGVRESLLRLSELGPGETGHKSQGGSVVF